MERFEKYMNMDKTVDLVDLTASEIEAVTDKKFILTIDICANCGIDELGADPDSCSDEEYEDMCEYILNTNEYLYKPYASEATAKFDGSLYGDTQWTITIEKSRPLTAQEVIKVKYDEGYRACIINLVD